MATARKVTLASAVAAVLLATSAAQAADFRLLPTPKAKVATVVDIDAIRTESNGARIVTAYHARRYPLPSAHGAIQYGQEGEVFDCLHDRYWPGAAVFFDADFERIARRPVGRGWVKVAPSGPEAPLLKLSCESRAAERAAGQRLKAGDWKTAVVIARQHLMTAPALHARPPHGA